jgi:tetratricopeptide (TPR) repeat protein
MTDTILGERAMRSKRCFHKSSCCLAIALLACALCAACKSQKVEQGNEAADKQSAANLIARADQLYAGREDLTHVREAVVQARQARTLNASDYDAAWRLAKFDYYLATHAKDNEERDRAFREGIEAGKAAVRLQDGKAEGHFWLGANYGGSVEAGTLAGLATVEDIRGEMEKVVRLDEGYQNGSAYMVLGLVDLKAPKLLGGDPAKAVSEMEKGLRFGETNAFLRLHLAEAYLAVKRNDDARKQLDSIIHMTPDPNYLPEYKEAVTQARMMLEKDFSTGAPENK